MKKLFLFAAACVALVACNNKDNAVNGDQPKEPGRQVTITATVDFGQGSNAPGRTVAPDTPIPTTADATVNFHWEKGDQIMLFDEYTPEWQFFTVIDNTINGNTANFTGTALQYMESYAVFYMGKNPSLEKLMAIMSPSGTDSVTYEANNFHPRAITGTGNETGIVLDKFTPVFQIPLKGNATVGKIDYHIEDKETVMTTISFGTGLLLTDTETPVYFPVRGVSSKGFTIKIYDTNDVCLLTKTVKAFSSEDSDKLLTFPALTVNAETPSPKDVFKAGSTFQITIYADEEHYNIFKYKYNSDQTFTCTYINVDGTDQTDVYASYCPCTKGDGNTFTFDFAESGYLDYNADVTPATAVMRPGKYESEYLSYTITNFHVNDVDILDQITVSKQPE